MIAYVIASPTIDINFTKVYWCVDQGNGKKGVKLRWHCFKNIQVCDSIHIMYAYVMSFDNPQHEIIASTYVEVDFHACLMKDFQLL